MIGPLSSLQFENNTEQNFSRSNNTYDLFDDNDNDNDNSIYCS